MSRSLAGLLALLLCAGFVRGATAAMPGVEVFAALPEETQPAISPDGHWLAWFERKAPAVGVVIVDVEARKTLRVLSVPEGDVVVWLGWQSNETLLMQLRVAPGHGGTGPQIVAANAISGESRTLIAPWQTEYLVAMRTSKPDTAVIASRPLSNMDVGQSGGYTHIAEMDVRTGKMTPIREGGKRTVRWFVDRDGRPLAREDWEWLSNKYCVYALTESSRRELLCRDDADPPILGGILADRSALVLLEVNGRAHQAAWALPLDGTPLRLLAELPDADVTNVFLDPYTDTVTGVRSGGSGSSVRWLEQAAQQRYDSLARAFPGLSVQPYAWTEDGSKTLALVSSASAPPVYYLTDFKTHKADIAAESYPGLAGVALGQVKEISYKARDGTEIAAYLATPPGGTAPFPLVVLPHGGPHARDFLAFDPLVQFLATRGYAVLQPQFRGSSGFGDAFRDAGNRQWGGLMQDDITDGVRAVVTQQLVDPHRVCIVGTTPYSGYAALAGAAFTPELYACAISINGLSDLPAYVTALLPKPGARIVSSSAEARVEKQIGKPGDPKLAARSPSNSVASITAHVLIMYTGSNGIYVTQSSNMAHALTAAGKDVSVVTLPADAWSNEPARVRIFQELDRFLSQHLAAR